MQTHKFKSDIIERYLVCPKSKAALVQVGDSLVSTDPDTRMKYFIRDGIPVMLVEEGVELSEADWRQIMRDHGRDENGRPVAG